MNIEDIIREIFTKGYEGSFEDIEDVVKEYASKLKPNLKPCANCGMEPDKSLRLSNVNLSDKELQDISKKLKAIMNPDSDDYFFYDRY